METLKPLPGNYTCAGCRQTLVYYAFEKCKYFKECGHTICNDCLGLIQEKQTCLVPDCNTEIDPRLAGELDLSKNNQRRDEQSINLTLTAIDNSKTTDMRMFLDSWSPLKHYSHEISDDKLEKMDPKIRNRISEKLTWYMTVKLSLSKIKVVYKRFLKFLEDNKLVFPKRAEFELITDYVIMMLLTYTPNQFINNDANFKVYISRDKVKVKPVFLILARNYMEKIMSRPPNHCKELFDNLEGLIDGYNWVRQQHQITRNYLTGVFPVDKVKTDCSNENIFNRISQQANHSDHKTIHVYANPAERSRKRNWTSVQYSRAYAARRKELSDPNAKPLTVRDASFLNQVLPEAKKITTVVQNIPKGKLRQSITTVPEDSKSLLLFVAKIQGDIVGSVTMPIPDEVVLKFDKNIMLFSLARKRAYRISPDTTNFLVTTWMNERIEIGSKLIST